MSQVFAFAIGPMELVLIIFMGGMCIAVPIGITVLVLLLTRAKGGRNE